MDDNLKQQYAEIANYVREYQAYSSGLLRKVAFKFIKDFFIREALSWKGLFWLVSRLLFFPLFLFDVIKMIVWAYPLTKGIDLLSDRFPDNLRRWMVEAVAEADRQSEFFDVIASDYYIDGMSRAIEAKFRGYDFAKLSKLHEIKTKQLSQSELNQATGVLLALLAFLLKSVPEELIGWLSSNVTRPWFGWQLSYASFKMWSFLAVAGAIVYVAFALMPLWLKKSEARRQIDPIGELLKYTEIRLSK